MIKSYSDISLENYYLINDIVNSDIEDIDKQVSLLAIIKGCSEEDILNLPIVEYGKEVSALNFLFEKPSAKHSNIPTIYKLNGVVYELMKDPSKMSTGQYIDYQSYLENKLGFEYILSTLLIPRGKKYGEYDIAVVIDDIKKYMNIQSALDICFFFQNKLLNTIKTILIYLDLMMKNKKLNPELKVKMMELKVKIKQEISYINGNGNI